jgi:hypothetical protein
MITVVEHEHRLGATVKTQRCVANVYVVPLVNATVAVLDASATTGCDPDWVPANV